MSKLYTFTSNEIEAQANTLLEMVANKLVSDGIISDKSIIIDQYFAMLVEPNIFTRGINKFFGRENSPFFIIVNAPTHQDDSEDTNESSSN